MSYNSNKLIREMVAISWAGACVQGREGEKKGSITCIFTRKQYAQTTRALVEKSVLATEEASKSMISTGSPLQQHCMGLIPSSKCNAWGQRFACGFCLLSSTWYNVKSPTVFMVGNKDPVQCMAPRESCHIHFCLFPPPQRVTCVACWHYASMHRISIRGFHDSEVLVSQTYYPPVGEGSGTS